MAVRSGLVPNGLAWRGDRARENLPKGFCDGEFLELRATSIADLYDRHESHALIEDAGAVRCHYGVHDVPSRRCPPA